MANPILDSLKLSGITYDLQDNSALHTLDDNVTSGGTNAVKGSGIYNAITAATGALAETIAEQGYQTSGDVQNAISGKADAASAVTDVRVTSDNGKKQLRYGIARNGTFGTDAVLASFSSGFTMYNKTVSIDTTVIAQKTDIPAVSGYADSVKYNSTSKYVEFYHGGTGGTKVFEYDASPFLIDGMVQNVEIKDVELSGETVTCLVITFNTDAGKQDINIPISEIFNSDNYYDKTAIDNIVSGINDDISEVSGDVATKQDALTPGDGIQISGNVISVTGAPLTIDDNVTSSSSNPVKSSGIYNFVTGETATKQDILVNQSNIKSINNESLLGSGNITTLQASVSGTTLILS